MEDHNEPQTIHKVVDDDQEENEVHKAHDCTSEQSEIKAGYNIGQAMQSGKLEKPYELEVAYAGDSFNRKTCNEIDEEGSFEHVLFCYFS